MNIGMGMGMGMALALAEALARTRALGRIRIRIKAFSSLIWSFKRLMSKAYCPAKHIIIHKKHSAEQNGN